MERKYAVRGKLVQIEEIEGIIAVRPESGMDANTVEIVNSIGDILRPGMAPLEQPDSVAFGSAGWTFLRPKDIASARVVLGLRGIGAVQRVFRELNGGRIFIGTDRLSIRFRDDLPEKRPEALLRDFHLEIIRRLTFAKYLYVVRAPPGMDPLQISFELYERKNPDIIYAEPQFIEHIPQRFRPSDPDYNRQWHLNNEGRTGGKPGADIHAEPAWETTRGENMRIAIIDNGFDISHPDLEKAVLPTSAYFREDFGGDTFLERSGSYPDDNHGTFCAGMAIARANNGTGGCGVAHEAGFVAIACLKDQVGTQATLARAIAYAADPSREPGGGIPQDGADVISCSLGPCGSGWIMNGTLKDAIDFAVKEGRGGLGTPIFWAVTNGNFQINGDEVCAYVYTIAVARSTHNDVHDNAGHGPELDFLATGVEVFSTESGGRYGISTGCSFAAPTAAGAGALVLAVNPSLKWYHVRQILRDTCDKIGGINYDPQGREDHYGWGRINAERAVASALTTVITHGAATITPSSQSSGIP
jgi:thermitase